MFADYIKEFWRVRRIDSSLTNTDFALYSYLLLCFEEMEWKSDRITQRGDLICGLLGINAKSLEESRNRLKQKGFIDFISKTTIDKNGKKRGVKGFAVVFILVKRLSNRLPKSSLNRDEIESKESRNDYTNSLSISIKETITSAVAYLNEKADKNYKDNSKDTVSVLTKLLKNGFTLDDIRFVIDLKVSQWMNDAKMHKYIRPETLFGEKFEAYLNEKPNAKIVPLKEKPQEVYVRPVVDFKNLK